MYVMYCTDSVFKRRKGHVHNIVLLSKIFWDLFVHKKAILYYLTYVCIYVLQCLVVIRYKKSLSFSLALDTQKKNYLSPPYSEFMNDSPIKSITRVERVVVIHNMGL